MMVVCVYMCVCVCGGGSHSWRTVANIAVSVVDPLGLTMRVPMYCPCRICAPTQVLGGETACWGHCMPSTGHPKHLPWPAILAVSERLWKRKAHTEFVATPAIEKRHAHMLREINAWLEVEQLPVLDVVLAGW